MKDIWPATILRGIKTFLITIGCLLSYVLLPALLVAVIISLLAIVYSGWTWFWIIVTSL